MKLFQITHKIKMSRSIYQILLLCFCILEISCQSPEVEIPQGRLLGDTRTNLDGGTYYSFLSIPYAEPPIGELRFRAPQPANSWEGIRDATQDLPSCVQPQLFGANVSAISGQEDCLYLNVHTPILPEENASQLPVMVYIHGGGFYAGTGSESMSGAQYLLTRDVVLVTINYRIGIFGFLSLDDPDLGVTGNAGMKDQVLALEWVRDNIEYFGGDPDNVLIFGQSAGSISVQLHIMSQMSNGLFHKAISQSGDATTELIRPRTRNNGAAMAQVLGIQTENWEEMLASLQEVSPYVLSATELSLNPDMLRMFAGPIVEIPSNEAFLDQRPIDIIRAGTFNQVPFIIGFTDAEGLLFQVFSRRNTGESILIEDFTDYVPSEFNVEGTPLEDLIAFVIRQFYYGDTQPSRDEITGAVELTTDHAFAFPTYRTVRECLRTAENPIYMYYFTAITQLNFFKLSDPTATAFPGVAHSDDLGYFMHIYASPALISGSLEERGVRNLVNLLTNFAIYGDPTPEDASDFTWDPVTENQFNYLDIGTEENVPLQNSVFTQERIMFWWSLYEQYASR